MSYRVDYNPEVKNRYPTKVKIRKKLPVRTVLAFVAAVVVCYGVIRCGLLRLLIPGDSTVTAAAFSGMIDDIGAGVSVRQALLTFCKEIIINAK